MWTSLNHHTFVAFTVHFEGGMDLRQIWVWMSQIPLTVWQDFALLRPKLCLYNLSKFQAKLMVDVDVSSCMQCFQYSQDLETASEVKVICDQTAY